MVFHDFQLFPAPSAFCFSGPKGGTRIFEGERGGTNVFSQKFLLKYIIENLQGGGGVLCSPLPSNSKHVQLVCHILVSFTFTVLHYSHHRQKAPLPVTNDRSLRMWKMWWFIQCWLNKWCRELWLLNILPNYGSQWHQSGGKTNFTCESENDWICFEISTKQQDIT